MFWHSRKRHCVLRHPPSQAQTLTESTRPSSDTITARDNRVLRLGAIEAGWLIVALATPLVFNPWGANSFELPKVALLRGVTLCMLLAAAARAPSLRHARQVPLPVWGAIALGAAYGAATLLSAHPLTSLWGTYERQQGMLTLLAYLVLFCVTATTLGTREQIERLWVALVWSSLPVVAYGAIQILHLDPFDWRTDAASPVVATLGRGNTVGTYLVLVVPLTVARMFSGKMRWAYGWLCTAQLAILALTLARSAWLGLAVGGLILGLLWAKSRHRRVLLGLAPLAIVVVTAAGWMTAAGSGSGPLGQLPGVGQLSRTGLADGGSVAARLTIWGSVLAVVRERPWLGYGPETVETIFTPKFPPELVYYQGREAAVDRVHNLWLDTAIGAGMGGVAALGLLIVALARQLRRMLVVPGDAWKRNLSIALCSALAGHLVDLQFTFDLTASAAVFWLLAAMCTALHRIRTPLTDQPNRLLNRVSTWQSVPIGAAALLLIGVACVRPLLADTVSARSLDESRSGAALVADGEAALRAWSLEPEYYLRLARLYALTDRIDDAEGAWLAAALLSPRPWRVWAAQGDAAAQQSAREPLQLARAEAAYRRASTAAPTIAAYHAAVGWALLKQNRLEEGVSELERAVALDATDPSAYRLLAEGYALIGRNADAALARQEAERWSQAQSRGTVN